MSVIPCRANEDLKLLIAEYAEVLRTEGHTLGAHGLPADEFYRTVFRGAIERLRGQFSATMSEKRDFARHVLNNMQDRNLITDWEPAGGENRHDYIVNMPSGRVAAVELKGCLDGNNTNIFTRPANANEFVIWSVCTNPGADPRGNVWSGLHTRLGAEIVANNIRVDGVVVWDMICGTVGRPCPKTEHAPDRLTAVGPYLLPPPCLYVFPSTVPTVRNNPQTNAQALTDVHFLNALHTGFQGQDSEVHYVDFSVQHAGANTQRKTVVRRDGQIVKESPFIDLRRE
ncbi:MAG: hypothetical protein SH850_02100 [Planctomycetaceae bacterium]|nr:hypothetical protein [Planctomycetaceae bacterium]